MSYIDCFLPNLGHVISTQYNLIRRQYLVDPVNNTKSKFIGLIRRLFNL